MRQYDIDFPKMLKNGLRPSSKYPGEGTALTYARNVYPKNNILAGLSAWTETFPTITGEVQFFSCTTGFYILSSTALYKYDGTTLTPLLTGLIAGGKWSVADFNAFVAFTNGTVTIVRKPNAEVWSIDSTSALALKAFIAFCHSRGRALGIKGNTVEWSRIGRLEFLDKDDQLGLVENAAGFRSIENSSTLYTILPLGQSVIVYGNGSIVAMDPYTVSGGQVINTYKFTTVDHLGAASANAIIQADEDTHYYVCNDGNLYKLTSKGRELLGFAEFIPTSTKLSYATIDRFGFVLAAGVGGSVLVGDAGLAGGSSFIGAVGFDVRCGFVCHSTSTIDMSTCEFWSDTIQLTRAGEKTIDQVILDAINVDTDEVDVAIGVKTSSSDAWTFSPWYTFNDSLEAMVGITGNLFMVKIRISNQQAPQIRNITLGIKYIDKRFSRGALGAKNDNQIVA